MNNNQRDTSIDIAKGIGIIAVVLGHTTFVGKGFLYQFHLPLFFFLSGMVWNEKKLDNIPKYLFSKIKALYFPFIIYEIAFLIFHNLFAKVGFYSEASNVELIYTLRDFVIQGLKILIMGAGEQLAGPLWFLISSLEIVIVFPLIYKLTSWIFKKDKIKECAIIIIGVILYFVGCYTHFPRMFSQSLIGIFFFTIGYIFKLHRKKIKLNWVVSLIGVIVITVCGLVNQVDISKLIITYKALLILSGLAGAYIVLFLGEKVSSIQNLMCRKFSQCIQFIGANTIIILALHCICFKFAMLLEWVIYRYDYKFIGTFPLYTESEIFVLLAFVLGIALPTFIKLLEKKFVNKMKKIKTK